MAIIRTIASLFLPERIRINGNLVSVSFLGRVLWTQDLSEIVSLRFFERNDFTGGKMLGIITKGPVAHDYFGQQIGFRHLTQTVLKKIASPGVDSTFFSEGDYPPDNFSWPTTRNPQD